MLNTLTFLVKYTDAYVMYVNPNTKYWYLLSFLAVDESPAVSALVAPLLPCFPCSEALAGAGERDGDGDNLRLMMNE